MLSYVMSLYIIKTEMGIYYWKIVLYRTYDTRAVQWLPSTVVHLILFELIFLDWWVLCSRSRSFRPRLLYIIYNTCVLLLSLTPLSIDVYNINIGTD